MKIKKILSSALALVMIFTALVAVIPTRVSAAYVSDSDQSPLTSDEIKEIVEQAMKYDFGSAEEMLAYEISMGYIDQAHSVDAVYSMYVNRYTGSFYYVNNATGQILTSNPYDYGTVASSTIRQNLMSQIDIAFSELASGLAYNYNSTVWAANYGQISVDYIKNGIRVNYTLGDTTARFLLPGRILASDFESKVILPGLERFEELMQTLCGEEYPDVNFSFIDNEKYEAYEYGCISSKALKSYFTEMNGYYTKLYKANKISVESFNIVDTVRTELLQLSTKYTLKNPSKYENNKEGKVYQDLIKNYYTPSNGNDDLEIYETLAPMYVFEEAASVSDKRQYSIRFQKYALGYTYTDMYADEEKCGYVDNSEQKPVFRCSLEYSFNQDGSLSVRLPASSITFDDTVYCLDNITPLKYFGAGNMANEGYIFYPDGSGAVMEFDDFYSAGSQLFLSSSIYGTDYCYTSVTGEHREQVTMPVYGLVNDVTANSYSKELTGSDTVTNGYFAILEEGSSLAKLGLLSGGVTHKYATVYCSYTPYPSDVFDITGSIGVGDATEYKIVSESKYNGSYVTRVVMLSDEVIGEKVYGEGKFYPASYSGMASYYRNYLEADGTLQELQNISDNLPLYLEVLGSMEISDKFLTFPIKKTIPLTTFDNVREMYNQLANAKAELIKKAENFENLAAAEDNENTKVSYLETAASYRAMADSVDNIDNVNFRLTGFGNGGMYYTYPTKVRWDNACGGKSALKELIKASEQIKEAGGNLGLYPDYDFQYLNYTAAFDGISNRGNLSKMVDNRYASKQTYNPVNREWESVFTMVINAASLEKFYAKFIKQYSKYDLVGVSLSTLGSDLNSNFDEDESVHRADAMDHVVSVLNSLKNDNAYSIMVDVGNIYSVKYADHILNIATDSSHFRSTSYSVPFIGMVLHGSVSYAGNPLNYAGSPRYDMLRSIENGAALYYILCYQNSAYLKEDDALNQYYGVDYVTWYDDIVTTYTELNAAIGDLQNYKIVDHKIIKGERIIEEKETIRDLYKLQEELLVMIDEQILAAINEGFKQLEENEESFGTLLTINIDRAAIFAEIYEILNKTEEDLAGSDFIAGVNSVIDKYESLYTVSTNAIVNYNDIDYKSQYSFLTDSLATDKDYVFTDYTSDLGNIVLVTYSNGTDTVRFVLNYNIYSVNINLGEGELITLGKHGYIRLD